MIESKTRPKTREKYSHTYWTILLANLQLSEKFRLYLDFLYSLIDLLQTHS